MASNYNRRSGSSGSNRGTRRDTATNRRSNRTSEHDASLQLNTDTSSQNFTVMHGGASRDASRNAIQRPSREPGMRSERSAANVSREVPYASTRTSSRSSLYTPATEQTGVSSQASPRVASQAQKRTASQVPTRSSSRNSAYSGSRNASNRQARNSQSTRSNEARNASRSSRSNEARNTSRTYVSRSVGEIQKQKRKESRRETRRRASGKLVGAAVSLVVLIVCVVALYLSPLFKIETINIEGANHLTQEEMLMLAAVPEDTTLLRVDTKEIIASCMRDAWIQDMTVRREFPHTLTLVVTERDIAAVVEVPNQNSSSTRLWAMSSDKMWLMPIPDQESEAGQAINPQIYADAETVLRISGVPLSTVAQIGTYCEDPVINNALEVVAGLTTELKDRVVKVTANDTESTTLTLDNGVEIAFGTAENSREKERICLELLQQHEGAIAYINVRSVSNPTWRAL